MATAAEQEKQKKAKEYEKYVKQVTPTHSLFKNMCCFILQAARSKAGTANCEFRNEPGSTGEIAGGWTSLILVLLSVLFTGFNIYPKIAKWGGAGTLVPITGFANSVAAPAIEYQKEGQVFGIGCKIFIIAGPVILYGILTSAVLGAVYYVLKLWGMVG